MRLFAMVTTLAAACALQAIARADDAPGAATQESAPPAANVAAAPRARIPDEQNYSYAWDVIDNTFVRPATRFFDVALLARKVTGHKREAANVDASDQVRLPSTWWQPRAGFRPLTAQQMLHGPGPGTGPAPGRWSVSHAKDQGVTVGFQIKDSKGQKFLVKFDPPGHPDLGSACDVTGGRKRPIERIILTSWRCTM